MTLEDKVHAFRLRVLHRAQELSNVSAACREAGISRTLYYRWKKRFVLYGIDGLHPRRTATHPGRPVQLDTTTERKIVATALSCPTWGPGRLSLQLEQEGDPLSPRQRCGEPCVDWVWEHVWSDCSSSRYTAPRAQGC